MSKAWPRVPLAEALRYRKEFVTIDDLTNYKRLRVQLHAQGVVLRDEVLGAVIKTKKQQACRSGDFVVAEIDAKVGGFGIVPDGLEGAIVSSHYFLFDVIEQNVDCKFLDYFIRTAAFRGQVEAQGSTNYAAIRPADVLTYEIPLPPIEEQRRIVARIEGLAAEVEQARTLRRQATEEAEALILSRLNEMLGNPYAGLTGTASTDRWEKLAAIVDDVADGPHVTPTYAAEGIPFITVLNITSGRIDFENCKRITEDDHKKICRRAKAERGDILISKDGTIGIPCVVDTDREFSFFVSVALIKPKMDIVDSEFLVYVIKAPYLQERIKLRSRGDMIRHLVLREIRDLTVPVPPLFPTTPHRRRTGRIAGRGGPAKGAAGRGCRRDRCAAPRHPRSRLQGRIVRLTTRFSRSGRASDLHRHVSREPFMNIRRCFRSAWPDSLSRQYDLGRPRTCSAR
jgi:type I restriction enzyme S subunit